MDKRPSAEEHERRAYELNATLRAARGLAELLKAHMEGLDDDPSEVTIKGPIMLLCGILADLEEESGDLAGWLEEVLRDERVASSADAEVQQ